MPNRPLDDAARRKAQLRRLAHAARDAQPDKDDLSRRIQDRFFVLPEYERARMVLFYLHIRSEVRTCGAVAAALETEKHVVVPYCVADRLELFHLTSFDELAPGTLGILEPAMALRRDPRKRVTADQLDLIMVPGVAFDRRGGRLGYGGGYFDGLLCRTRPDARRIAVAFQCQIVDEVPMLRHDVFMHAIVTEEGVIEAENA